MDRDEIERYLGVGRRHSIVVDVREIPEAPGNVRTVTIHRGYRVTIEYDQARAYVEGSSEGGGLKYVTQYDDLDALLADLEEHLGARIDRWVNYTARPKVPTLLDDPDPEKSRAYFEDLVRRGGPALPRRATYELAGAHWRALAPDEAS